MVNATPDSFSDAHPTTAQAVAHGLELLDAGADLLDVGGESTRPGAARVPVETELERVVPVVRELVRAGAFVTVDTTRAPVARAALEAGAVLVNDVSGGAADPAMLPLVAEAGCPVVLMHWRGPSADMQSRAVYDDVVAQVHGALAERFAAAVAAGVAPDLVVLDPGLGFGKTAEHNWALLRALPELVAAGRPVLLGASRKGFLGALLSGPGGTRPPAGRDAATTALTVLAAQAGAWAVRVHDVRSSVDAVRVVQALAGAGRGSRGHRGGAGDVTAGEAAEVEVAAVEAANAAFYAAYEQADVDAMAQVWDDERPEALTCVHPGWPPLRGRTRVLRSWSAIMATTDYIQFFLTDVSVAVEGDHAIVTCTENVLTGIAEQGGAGAATATNVFRRRADGWRLQTHHAGPLMPDADDGEAG